jgi:hypothetical protein
MSPPAGPIYASTLHRRDRAWRRSRRRRALRARIAVWSAALAGVVTALALHFG